MLGMEQQHSRATSSCCRLQHDSASTQPGGAIMNPRITTAVARQALLQVPACKLLPSPCSLC